MKTTTNYGLWLPESTDRVDIEKLNDNMQEIDERIAANADSASKAYLTAFNTPTTDIPSGANLDDYVNAGCFKARNAATAGSLINCPVTDGFRMEVRYISDATRRIQTLYPNNTSGYYYIRNYIGTGWGPWYRYGGEAVAAVNPASAEE